MRYSLFPVAGSERGVTGMGKETGGGGGGGCNRGTLVVGNRCRIVIRIRYSVAISWIHQGPARRCLLLCGL